MSGIVQFNLLKFRKLYPKISATDDQLSMFFVEASMSCNNTEHSVIHDLQERELLLFLLTAHIATLQQRIDSGNEAVGRIASASEGSVSVVLDNGQTKDSEKWYQQTPYGARYWVLTKRYRSFFYVLGKFPMPVRR
ncbi:DUF4054 domain-containing protein [Snodgrassella sp. M0351]|uniref:DUF4054 domain-containing protein n=1 Tax=Snodgrassella sp. M0351 TaxID=2751012 RepID=UPI0018DCAF76|nr:DUF4054 domain-containing protein [Snodgrassella sp. M0351]MBI0164796.1 DUF4054 domain-containing protein [Snodgrassella sp. M0351]